MSNRYEKARAIAEAAANRWDAFGDTQGISRLADMIMEFGALSELDVLKWERDQERARADAFVKQMNEAWRYATRLAQALLDKHFPNPNWSPLPDLYGVLTQIDNMTCGLSRSATASTAAGAQDDADVSRGSPSSAALFKARGVMSRPDDRDEAIAEVTVRLKNYSLSPCLDCGGQGYTDMGKSACFWCRGAGVITQQMAHAFGIADRAGSAEAPTPALNREEADRG